MAEPRTSRRAVLTTAVAGAVAAIGSFVGGAGRARAADGDPVILGNDANTAATKTAIIADVSGSFDAAFEVTSTGLSASAVRANARPTGGIGLRAEGSHGVMGTSFHNTGAGVVGEDATGNILGRGVIGVSQNGWGVAAVSANGQALRVDGRATFNRAGIVTITHPSNRATVSVPGSFGSSTTFPERPSFALATLQTNRPGLVVQAAILDPSVGTLTIRLNKSPGLTTAGPVSVSVGWMVVN